MAGLFSGQTLVSPSRILDDEDADGPTALSRLLSPAYLADLSLAEILHQQRTLDTPHTLRPRMLALLLAVQPEIARLGMLSAIDASLANALERRARDGSAVIPRTLLRYFPSVSSTFMLAASRLRRGASHATSSQWLDEFHAAIDAATQATVSLAASSFALQPGATVDERVLAECWRRACRAAKGLLQAIDFDLAAFRIARDEAASKPLLSALSEAADGGMPMLDASGEVVIPAWVDTRRAPRVSVDCSALLRRAGDVLTIVLTDISTIGAGFRSRVEMTVGERVTLLIDQSIVMAGTVIWWRDGTTGIAFDQPFFDDSPELRFLTGGSQKFTEA